MRRANWRIGGLVMLLVLGGSLVVATNAQQADVAEMSDARFLEQLDALVASGPQAGATVDRRRLGKLLFGQAATLVGGRTSLRLLQNVLLPRESEAEMVREIVAESYEEYDRAVEGFRAAVSSLLDRPESDLRMHRALMAGHRACWRQDRYTRLAETYGAESVDLVRALASIEACGAFRRAAFNPVVQRLVDDALREAGDLADEAEALRVELVELESLLEDLEELDGEP